MKTTAADDGDLASKAARELSKRGASKGGKARAEKMTPEQRAEVARKAASARWGLPQATHDGEVAINGAAILCAVLQDQRRVLTQESFLSSIGRARKAKAGTGSRELVDGLPPFLAAANLKPFISKELRESTAPVPYRTTSGGRAYGYSASTTSCESTRRSA